VNEEKNSENVKRNQKIMHKVFGTSTMSDKLVVKQREPPQEKLSSSPNKTLPLNTSQEVFENS
jgi:hypothetical protein